MNLLSILFQEPILFAIIVAAIVLTLSVHEFAHAYVGHLLGDHTAEREGRLTINPLAHIDPVGFLMLLMVGFGYAKPVPYDPYQLRDPRMGSVLIAIAGPGSNLLFGALASALHGWLSPILGIDNLLVISLLFIASINFSLMLFNLIPVPPLDGSKVLLAMLTAPEHRQVRIFLETQGPMILLGLIVLDAFAGIGVFSWIFSGSSFLFGLFSGG